MSEDGPKLFRAICDFNTGEEGDLVFRAGQVIVVSDQGEGVESWWEGELDGKFGCFPGTFVKPLAEFLPNKIGGVNIPTEVNEEEARRQDAQEEDEKKEEQETAQQDDAVTKDNNLNISTLSILKSSSRKDDRNFTIIKHVSFNPHAPEIERTFAKDEYERAAFFNPEQSHRQWELEEPQERLRMLQDRWIYLESKMPPGSKCEERLAHEEEERQKELEVEKKRQRRIEAKLKIQQRRMKREQEMIGSISQPLVASTTTPPNTQQEPSKDETRAERLRRLKERRDAKKREAEAKAETKSDNLSVSESASPLPVENRSTAPPPPTPSKKEENISADNTDSTANTQESDAEGESPLDQAISGLEETIEKLQREDTRGRSGYFREFQYLDGEDRRLYGIKKKEAGMDNRDKNRYNDIIPYDETRVVVGDSPNASENYINASRLKGLLPGSPHFIAAQGPLPNSIDVFWKMIVQEKTRLIIMVTNCVEGTKTKCEKYWPDYGKNITFKASPSGPAVQVFGKGETAAKSWVKREFRVSFQEDGERQEFVVTQLHFISWPDRGVPETSVLFLGFLHKAMALQNKANNSARDNGEPTLPPMVVHCSAGVGRTGVFILVYAIMTYLPFVSKGGKYKLKILPIIKRMRTFRRYLVQTPDQYKFCHDTVLYATKFYRQGTTRLKRASESDIMQQQQAEEQPPKEQQSSTVDDKKPQESIENDSVAEPRVLVLAPADDIELVQKKIDGADVLRQPLFDIEAEDDEESTPDTDPATPTPISKSVDIKPLGVWHHPHRSRIEGADMLEQDAQEGLFLITGTFQGSDGVFITVYTKSGIESRAISSSLAGFSIQGSDWPGSSTLEDFVLELAKKSQPDIWDHSLLSFIPYRGATMEEIAGELNRLKSASMPPKPFSMLQQPPMSQRDLKFGEIVIENGSDAKKKTFRSKMKKFKSKLTRSRMAEDDPTILIQPFLSHDISLDSVVLSSNFHDNGDVLEVSSQCPLIGFADGVYMELETQFCGFPAYKLMKPIDSTSAVIDESSVYIVIQPEDRTVVLFLPKYGPLAVAQTKSGDPTTVYSEWHLFCGSMEVLQPVSLQLQRLDALPPNTLSFREQISELNDKIAAANALNKALQRENREAMDEVVALTKRLSEKRASSSSMNDSITVPKEEWTGKDVVIQKLRDEVTKLGMTEEGLSRRVERLEKLVEEKEDDLNKTARKEEETSRRLESVLGELEQFKNASSSTPTKKSQVINLASSPEIKQVLDLTRIDEEGGPRRSILIDDSVSLGFEAEDVDVDEINEGDESTSSSAQHAEAVNNTEGGENGSEEDEEDVDDILVSRLMGRRSHSKRNSEVEKARLEAQKMATMFAADFGISEEDPTDQEEFSALYDYEGEGDTSLTFAKGEKITVTGEEGEFYFGRCEGRAGWFPKNLVATNL
eukprot:m.219360 g.219360  ORF g.219360 m.219360 type:complete len:1424 (-) comp13823_c0_seq2:127-4398(-)